MSIGNYFSKIFKGKKTALVLGGGSARGIAHIGVVRVLQREKINFDLIVGTSIGAFVGASYALGQDMAKAEEMALRFNATESLDFIIPPGLGLIKGERIYGIIKKFVGEKKITAGTIQGIGATKDNIFGYFDIDRKEYLRCEVPASCELVNFQGNISLVEGKPFIHAHVLLTKPDFSIAGGHCFSGIISVTGEFCIYPISHEIKRTFDEEVKLNLINLEK